MAATLALLSSSQARAASRVALSLTDCGSQLSESALREHLELELATLGLADVEAQFLLRCEDTRVAIDLGRASGERYPVAAEVELAGTAQAARERLVALAASELLAQAERARADQRPASPPSPAPAPQKETVAPPGASDRAAPPAASRPPIELFVGVSAGYSGEPKTALWGGSLGTRWGLSRSWSVLLDLRFERGEQSLPLARVRSTLLSGFVGAGESTRLGPLQLSAGLGMRAGWLALEATAEAPNEGQSLTAPWAGVALPLRLAFDAGGQAMPFLGAELGYVMLPVRGTVDDGSVLVAERGFWLAATLGVTVVL